MDPTPTSFEPISPNLADAQTVVIEDNPESSDSVAAYELSQSVVTPGQPTSSGAKPRGPVANILIFGGAALLTITAATLLVNGAAVLAEPYVKITYPLFAGAVLLLSIFGLIPIYKQLGLRLDQLIRTRGLSPSNLRPDFESELAAAADVNQVAAAIHRRVHEITTSDQLHIFIFDPTADYFFAASINGEQSSDLQFHRNSAVVQALSTQKAPLLRTGQLNSGVKFPKDDTRLEILGADALFPLVSKEQLLGWIAVGERTNHRALTLKQIDLLDRIAGQAARSMERFQLVTRLETRMHQMDVLSRVAQGVNFTLALDDIFELIYAQTTQLLPTDEFRILLFDSNRKDPVLVFSILGDERCPTRRQRPPRRPEPRREAGPSCRRCGDCR